MYAVTVTFTIKDGQMGAFLRLMHENARTSLNEEPDCHQFDVCTDPGRAGEVFLYELYRDAEAFQAHLASAHFKAFDAAVADMVADKDVRLYTQVAQ
ncbi:MAG: putative quinol monooxygenase [Pseudomonadota bacterium]